MYHNFEENTTKLYVTLNVGYSLIDNGIDTKRYDTINNINISAQVAGEYINFTKASTKTLTIDRIVFVS